jgi:hypothetical protein
MKKDAYYFSHDSNARNDHKIIKLRRKFGIEGYGIYFCIIELLRDQSNYTLPLASFEDIAYELQIDADKVKAIINDFELFTIDQNHFYSSRLKRSLEEYNELKNKRSAIGKLGGLKSGQAKVNQTSSKIEAKVEQNESKSEANDNQNSTVGQPLKESKVKESKEEKKKVNKKEFVPPTVDDVISYFSQNGYSTEAAGKAFRFYESGDWHDSNGKKIKNWKQKMNGVWFKEEHKLAENPIEKSSAEIAKYRDYIGFKELLHNPQLGYSFEVDEVNKIIRYKRENS